MVSLPLDQAIGFVSNVLGKDVGKLLHLSPKSTLGPDGDDWAKADIYKDPVKVGMPDILGDNPQVFTAPGKPIKETTLELSDEDMKKLHKDGKITLPNGSVLHYTGTVKDDSQLKSEIVLTPEEKATLQNLTESINEGMVDLSKVKDYAKKGLMTLGVIATLLGGANLTLQQKQDVVDTVKTEIPSENQKDLQYMSDAAIAHSLYLTNKADVEKLAQTNSDIYLLIKDSKFQNFDKLDRVQDKITIGRSNQEAIRLIKGTVLEGVVKSAQLKEAIKSLIKKTLES